MPGAGPRPYALWSDYLAVTRRHLVLMGVLILAGLAAGVVGTLVAPKTWAATASVLVAPTGVGVNNPGAGRAPAGVDLDSEAQLALSEPVLLKVRAAIGNVVGIEDRLDISVPPNSGILRFTYTAPAPDEAAAGANAFAKAYLEDRRSRAEATLAKLIQSRRDRVTALQAELKAQPPPVAGRLSAQREVLTRLIAAETRAIDTLTSTRIRAGAPLDAAKPPSRPIAPDAGVWTASGFSAGLLLAVIAAAVVDRYSLRIRRAAEVPRVHGLHVLGELPANSLSDDRLGAGAFDHAAAELLATIPPGGRLLTVTGTTADAPSAAVATALAAALAHVGNDVLLVFSQAADVEVARSLGAGSLGFSAVVLDLETAEGTARPVSGVARLRVLGPGAEAGDAAQRFVDPDDPSVDALRAGVDYVLMAAGAVLVAPEAAPLARRADGTILVVPLRRTSHGALRRVLRRLSRARVLGVVVCPPRAAGVGARLRRAEAISPAV